MEKHLSNRSLAFAGIDMSKLAEYSEAQERENVRLARWTVMHEGKLLPVTTLFGSDGNETANPFRALMVVAYDRDLPNGKWLTIDGIKPGEVLERHNGQVPGQSGAGRN